MNILFLDDDPNRTRSFRSEIPYAQFVETASGCIEKLKSEHWDVVFLDHDLGGEVFVDPKRDDSGSAVVRWIESNKPKIQKIVIHTCNHLVAGNMATTLSNAGYETNVVPFHNLIRSLGQILQRKIAE